MKKIIKHLKKNWIRHGFETLAVLVGVLAAFSLNNWNDNRRKRIVEIETLISVNENLKNIRGQLEGLIMFDKKVIGNYNIILAVFERDSLVEIDDLQRAFGYFGKFSSPLIDLGFYETLKFRGIDLVSNESIGKEISTLYEFHLIKYLDDWDKTYWAEYENVVLPMVSEIKGRLRDPAFDASSLKKNYYFLNMTRSLKNEREVSIEIFERTIEKIQISSEIIIQEIEQLR